MIEISSIASGSNGNCYYIGNETSAILIDAGVSCKQIVNRMSSLGLDISKLKGIFVTHEHSDHIKGINVFSTKFKIPIYISEKTHANSPITVASNLVNFFKVNEHIDVGNFCVHSFAKQHDAADPCSFIIHSEGKKIAVLTDIGAPCKNVIKVLKESDVVFLESNYDDEMLANGKYPYFLKKRISGDCGHMSNYQAGLLVLQHAKDSLTHVFLSHLSENNNTPELAHSTFTDMIKERKDLRPNVILTDRDKETQIFRF
jgi:phosphoribosyl 1,2-cyclic phosphodiesterase